MAIKAFLSSIDLFGAPILINFSGKSKFSSPCGGVCTLLFIGFVIWVLYDGSKNLFFKENPNTIFSESFDENPKQIIISSEIFPFAYGVEAPDTYLYTQFVNETIYKQNFTYIRQERVQAEDGSIEFVYTTARIYTEPCTPDHFGELAASFSYLQLSTLFCIAKEQPELDKISIQGTAESEVYEVIRVIIMECNNDTSEVPCAPRETLDAWLSGAWFYAHYANMAVDPKNYSRPDMKYRDVYYTMISPANYKYSLMNLEHVNVITDSGWLVEDQSTKNYVKVDDVDEFLQFKAHPQKLLISFDLTLSRVENSYSRSYTKIQDVLAGAGGLANASLLVLIILVTPYIKAKFYESVVNETFNVNQYGNDLTEQRTKMNLARAKSARKTKYRAKDIQGERNKKFTLNLATTVIDHKLTTNQDHKTLEILGLESPSSKMFLGSNRTKFDSLGDEQAEAEPKSGNVPGHFLQKKPIFIQTNIDTRSQRLTRTDNHSKNEEAKKNILITKDNSQLASKSHQNPEYKDFKLANTDGRFEKSQTRKRFEQVPEKVLEPASRDLSFLSDLSMSNDEKFKEDRHTEIIKENKRHHRSKNEPNPENTHPDQKISILSDNEAEKIEENIVSQDLPELEMSEEKIGINYSQQEHKKIDIGFLEFFCSFFTRSKATQQKLKLLDEGRRKIEERLDILNLLRKLRDIDKFRAVLLDEDQTILFNHLPKPEISTTKPDSLNQNYVHQLLKRSTFINEAKETDKIKDVCNRLQGKNKKSNLDIKLLQIFSQNPQPQEDQDI